MRQLLTPSNAENSPIRTNFATEPFLLQLQRCSFGWFQLKNGLPRERHEVAPGAAICQPYPGPYTHKSLISILIDYREKHQDTNITTVIRLFWALSTKSSPNQPSRLIGCALLATMAFFTVFNGLPLPCCPNSLTFSSSSSVFSVTITGCLREGAKSYAKRVFASNVDDRYPATGILRSG